MDDMNRITKIVNDVVNAKDLNQLMSMYKEWADQYDQDNESIEYKGHDLFVNAFVELGLPRQSRILDIGAGTGMIGLILKKNGFADIDALDGSNDMLKVAEQKNCYTNLYQSFVTKDTRLPIGDKTYDAVVMCGCMCPGHIKWDSFPQIIRLVKPGGIICWILSNWSIYKEADPEWHHYSDRLVEQYCSDGLWHHINGYPRMVQNYLSGIDAKLYAMKVV